MFRIITPADFTTSRWKNGGGITHEIARQGQGESWNWRLSIAEVGSDGPFSLFAGMARILTVIEGAGLDLHLPDSVLEARLCQPVHFSGDVALESRMVNGAIRDFNLIYDPRLVEAGVQVSAGPSRFDAEAGLNGFLCLSGRVTVAGVYLPEGAFALGSGGEIVVPSGASGLRVTIRDLS